MSVEQFDNLTHRQYYNITNGYFNKLERKEFERRQACEMARWQMFYTVAPHHDKEKYGELKLTDLLMFSWDPEDMLPDPETEQTTAEDIAAVKARWEERDKNRGLEQSG